MTTKEQDGKATKGAQEEEELAQKAMGDFGRWQLSIILLLSALKLPIAWNQLGIVFLAAPTPYHCTNSSLPCETEEGDVCRSWEYERTVFSETIITEVYKHNFLNSLKGLIW